MEKNHRLVIISLVSFVLSAFPLNTTNTNHKKQIVLLTSKGGSGHTSCTNRLKELFGDRYDIQVINPLESILSPLDTLRKLSRGRFDGEQLHNHLAQQGWNRSLNFFCRHIAPIMFKKKRRFIEKLFTRCFEKIKPDLVISTIPLINYSASRASRLCGSKYMLITLDLDLSLWLLDVKKCAPYYFPITTAFDHTATREQLIQQGVPSDNIHVVGPCLRQSFLEEKNSDVIKKEWNIPKDKKVVMVMMGGAGSRYIHTICKKLFKTKQHMHVLACVGRDQMIAEKIKRLKCLPCVSYSVIPFTNKIADLMTVSDVLITKPGGQITGEALALGLPLIFDNTKPMLFWECEAALYTCNQGYGHMMRRLNQLPMLLQKTLSKPNKQERMVIKNFDQEISKIVSGLLGSSQETKS